MPFGPAPLQPIRLSEQAPAAFAARQRLHGVLGVGHHAEHVEALGIQAGDVVARAVGLAPAAGSPSGPQ